MLRALILAGLASLAIPAGAHAHNGMQLIGPVIYQRWAAASLVPTPHLRVHVYVAHECGVDPACMFLEPFVIYMSTADQRPIDRLALFHEVGHIFDDSGRFPHAKRLRYEQLAGFPRQAWDPGEEDRATSPHEQFANDYAWCAVYGPGVNVPGLPWRVSPAIANICRLI
jgi:hypothetical protein